MKKGIAILSETVLSAFSLVISFVLIILVVYTVFSQQTTRTYAEVFKSVGRDVATAIDRAAALAGSGMIEQEIPKGLKMNITIDYKSIFMTYDGKTIKKSFSGLLNSGPYRFENPEVLCIIKNRNNNKILIVDKPCSTQKELVGS